MDRIQLEAHLALHGWEAWVEKITGGLRYNLTHRDHGTIWVNPYRTSVDTKRSYRYGFEDDDDAWAERVEPAAVPEREFDLLVTEAARIAP